MTRISPPLAAFHPITADDYALLACIRPLAKELPDGFAVFHRLGRTLRARSDSPVGGVSNIRRRS